jgi:hypothetical protein
MPVTTKEISDRILARLDDPAGETVAADPNGPVPPEILAAINEGQELFSLLTLCLEQTDNWTLPASTPWLSVRASFPDFLVPLRVQVGSTRIRPATIAELDAENDQWQATQGTPARYLTRGFNLFAFTPQPITDTVLTLTRARAPVQLVADAFPEIPEEYHGTALLNYGVYRIKLKEGAQGLQRGMGYLNAFLDDAQRLGDFVRARSQAARYDALPFELKLFDRSRLIKALKEKTPWQKSSAS